MVQLSLRSIFYLTAGEAVLFMKDTQLCVHIVVYRYSILCLALSELNSSSTPTGHRDLVFCISWLGYIKLQLSSPDNL